MLKRGAIVSGSLFAVGVLAIWLLGEVGILNSAAIVAVTQSWVYLCLAVFGIFWMIHSSRKKRP